MPVTLSSPVYVLTCSVCQAECFGKKEWLSHLTQNDHQKLARQECMEKWDSELRKCSLIVFTSKPLTGNAAGEIVKYFSTQFTGGNSIVMVTDFIWWDDRPQIGILQFESRAKAEDVFKASGCQNYTLKIQIDGSQWVQVKRGVDLLELEWHAILPPKNCLPGFQDSRKRSSKSLFSDDQVDPNRPIDNRPVTDTSVESMELEFDVSVPDQPLKKLKLNDHVRQSKLIAPLSVLSSDKLPPSPMTRNTHPLQFQFWSIRKAMLVPDLQYQHAMEAVTSLKTLLSQLSPELEVFLFGSRYLKLKYPDKGKFQVYVHKSLAKLRKILSLQDSHISNKFILLKAPKKTLKVKHVVTNVKINIVTTTRKGCRMEMQVCRLIEYMCQFDPRCHALITLVCYWVKINSIQIGGETDPENPLELPPHYTVYWLVLYYMIRMGFIPSPREILKNCPDNSVKDPVTGASIGFKCHPSYVKLWKSKQQVMRSSIPDEEFSHEFILEMLRLFYNFLEFCRRIFLDQPKNCNMNLLILNTHDGLQVKTCRDLNNILPNRTVQDIWVNRGVTTENMDELLVAVQKRDVAIPGGFHITHPLLFSEKLSFSEDFNFGANKTIGRIRNFIDDKIGRLGVKDSLEKVGGLEKLLTINYN